MPTSHAARSARHVQVDISHERDAVRVRDAVIDVAVVVVSAAADCKGCAGGGVGVAEGGAAEGEAEEEATGGSGRWCVLTGVKGK